MCCAIYNGSSSGLLLFICFKLLGFSAAAVTVCALSYQNIWTNNAASGGFAGFTFPNAPRAIKDHRNVLKADGFPFNPSERPLLLFRNNTVHSTGVGGWGVLVLLGGFT